MENSDNSENLREELERLRAENLALKQQLSRAATMIALGELVGTVTHEFNNILMTVMNYARIGYRRDEKASRDNAFQKILTASERAEKITRSVLSVARNRSPKPESTDIAQLTEDSLMLLEREMTRYHVSVIKEFDPNAPEALVCGNQIQEILLNFLINARQAMPNGGDVLVKIQFNAKTQTVDLSVRDYGTGIPADVLPHIFEPFFSTKAGPDDSGKGGTGLGLSRCKQIMDDLHGKISVKSTVGKGTMFTLKLPVAPAEP